jgi:predicted RNA-binding Zn-ribbon protein involved in translation (DUF1610 family)
MKLFQNFNEMFRNLKHRRPTMIFCPKCCSPDIKKSSSLDSWLIPAKYICEKCGYLGPIIMELEKKEEDTKKKD